MVETNSSIVTDNSDIQSLLDTTIGWGDKCVSDQQNYGRGGFCNFAVRNLLAAHSLGSYVLGNVGNSINNPTTVIDTQFIMVERDGSTRNGLVAQYAQLMYSNDAEIVSDSSYGCVWPISAECQSDDDREIDNTCGVPHSSMAIADNIGSDPYYLWWNITYLNGIIAWATDGDFPDKFNDDSEWDGGKTQCLLVDMYDPPDYLFADVPQPFEIILNIGVDIITEDVENLILDGLSTITGVPRGILELTVKVTQDINLDEYTGDDTDARRRRRLSDDDEDNYVLIEAQVCYSVGDGL